MKRKTLVLLLALAALLVLPAQAHPGRTDANGGHNSASGYHYHHGYEDHQHPNGVCPYDFGDRTGQSSGSSSSGGSTSSSSSQNSNTVAATPKKSGVDPAALYFPILVPAIFLVYKLFYALGKFLFGDSDVGCLGGLAASAFFLVILFAVGGGAFWLCDTLAPHISAGAAWCINIVAAIIFGFVIARKLRRRKQAQQEQHQRVAPPYTDDFKENFPPKDEYPPPHEPPPEPEPPEQPEIDYEACRGQTLTAIAQMCDMPKDTFIATDGLPATRDAVKISPRERWGSKYTFFRAFNGSVYHSSFLCGTGQYYATNAAEIPSWIRPCKRCRPVLPDLEWYRRFEKIRLELDRKHIPYLDRTPVPAISRQFHRLGWDKWADDRLHNDEKQIERQDRAHTDNLEFLRYDKTHRCAEVRGTTGCIYRIDENGCNCEDFKRHQKPCKHMYCVVFELERREKAMARYNLRQE